MCLEVILLGWMVAKPTHLFLKVLDLGSLRSCCWLTRFLVRLFFWLEDGYLLLESLCGRERADASPIMSCLCDPVASGVATLGLVAPRHVESSAVILAGTEESSGGPKPCSLSDVIS